MSSTRTTPMLSAFRFLVLLPILGGLFYIIALKIVSPVEYANSDFFTFWLSGHMAVTGQNPYDASVWTGAHHQFGATWIPNATYIYPLPLSLLFVPLGLLPVYPAFLAWVVLSQFMMLFSLILLVRARPNPRVATFIVPLLAGVIVFRATLLTLENGQLSGLLLLVISSIVYLWERQQWWQGALLLPILALKPNLGVPIILMLSLYLIAQKQFRAFIGGAAAGVLLLIIGWLQNPSWMVEFWRAGNTKLSQIFGFAPTIWGMSAYLCNHVQACSIGSGSVAGLAITVLSVWLVWRMREVLSPLSVAGLAVILTLVLTPTAWPYDQLLLVIPILAATLGLANAQYPYLPVALIFLATDVIAWVLLGVSAGTQTEIWNVAIPFITLGLWAWYLSVQKRAAHSTSKRT